MRKLFIDIETIPDQREGAYDEILAAIRADFKAPSGLTKEQAAADLGITDKDEIKFTSKDAMLARWEREMAETKAPELAEQQWRKTALNGARGQIAVICWAFDDEPAATYHGLPEGDLLRRFFVMLESHLKYQGGSLREVCLIGHNVFDFDLRFLFQRAVINQVRPPFSLTPSRYSDTVYDTMTAWAGFGNRISLDNLCKTLGVPTPKTDLDGSKVWDYVRDGRISEVAEYCRRDVEATRQCYRLMTWQPAAEPEEVL